MHVILFFIDPKRFITCVRRPPKVAEGGLYAHPYHLVFDEEGEYRLGDTSPGVQESHAQQALARASAAGRGRSAEAAAVLVGLGGDGILS